MHFGKDCQSTRNNNNNNYYYFCVRNNSAITIFRCSPRREPRSRNKNFNGAPLCHQNKASSRGRSSKQDDL